MSVVTGIGLILLLLFVSVAPALIGFRVINGRRMRRIWRSLDVAGEGEVFSEKRVSGLPPLAQRHFLHAIDQETPLAASLQVTISGSVCFASQAIERAVSYW